jgi:hypothetical protein
MKLRSDDFFDIESKQTGLFYFILDWRGSKKFIPKHFGAKKKTNLLFPNYSRSKWIKKVYPKTFWSEEKTNLLTQKFSKSKWIEKFYHKTF